MRFVHWVPLDEAPARTPRAPGVFQIRIAEGLVAYPTGKSAMIHYGADRDLQRAVRELAEAHPGAPWLCRHSVELTPAEALAPEAVLEKLLGQFNRRFGASPSFPDPVGK